MTFAVGAYSLLGLILALLGFLKRPRTRGELVYPRFVVPLLMWLLAIFPAAYYYYVDPPNQTYSWYRYQYQEKAILYVLLCMVMFWIGFRIRFRLPRVESFVHGLTVHFDYPRVQRAAMFMATASLIFTLAAHGTTLWDGSDSLMLPGVIGYIDRYIVQFLNVLAAISFGFGWPEKGEPRRAIVWIGAIYIIFVGMLFPAANFSRASGIMPMLMVLGYIGRFRRIPWITFLGGIFLLIYSAQVGIYGRGLYGHSGGFVNYATCFLNGANFSWLAAAERVMAGEALTSISVIFAADASQTDLGQITPLQWFYFQVPLPHIAGFGGTYTLDPTIMLGGVGNWGYTASMYGDTYAHMGWWGCIPFVYMGMLYRFLEVLVSGHDGDHSGGTLAFLTLPAAYYGLLVGTFNTFRAWNSGFTFGIAIILVAMWIYARFRNAPPVENYLPAAPPESASTYTHA